MPDPKTISTDELCQWKDESQHRSCGNQDLRGPGRWTGTAHARGSQVWQARTSAEEEVMDLVGRHCTVREKNWVQPVAEVRNEFGVTTPAIIAK